MMVFSAFTNFDKCPLVIIPPDRRTTIDFVTRVYEGTLSGFYFLHNELEDLTRMEDGAFVHRSAFPKHCRKVHGIKD